MDIRMIENYSSECHIDFKEQKCSNCIYFINYEDCIRHAPVITIKMPYGGFPKVTHEMKCGDFVRKEIKN